jgi:hypothetical protein
MLNLIAPLQSSYQDDRNGGLVHPIRSLDEELCLTEDCDMRGVGGRPDLSTSSDQHQTLSNAFTPQKSMA